MRYRIAPGKPLHGERPSARLSARLEAASAGLTLGSLHDDLLHVGPTRLSFGLTQRKVRNDAFPVEARARLGAAGEYGNTKRDNQAGKCGVSDGHFGCSLSSACCPVR